MVCSTTKCLTYTVISGLYKLSLHGSSSCRRAADILNKFSVVDHRLGENSVISFRFIPNSVVTRPVSAFWIPGVQEPWYRLPRPVRLTIGWLCFLGIVFGSAFGFKPQGVSSSFYEITSNRLNLFMFPRTPIMVIVLSQ